MALSYNACRSAILSCLRAGTTPHVQGAPGIGKSSMLASIAGELGLELQIVVGSTVGDDDIVGTPYVDSRTGGLNQAHRGPLKAAIEGPCLLALDEFSTVSEAAQASMLALILDRRAGDKPLHPGTKIVVLSNPPEHAPGAMRLSAATANRMATFRMVPSVLEIADWFRSQDDVHLAEYGTFLALSPDLVELEPSTQDIEAGRTWASPRGCELAIRAFGTYARDAGLDLAGGKGDAVAMAIVAGAMGAAAAGRYFAQREARRHLPPLDTILANPRAAAKSLKDETGAQIAAVSILPTIRRHDTGAAWLWAECLEGRFKGAATATLMAPGPWVTGAWEAEGRRAQAKLIAGAVKRK